LGSHATELPSGPVKKTVSHVLDRIKIKKIKKERKKKEKKKKNEWKESQSRN